MRISLLKQLSELSAPAGYEGPVRELVLKEIEPLIDEFVVDAMGNIIALKKAKKSVKKPRKVMASAHMDEIGFLVKYIDDDGFILLQEVGGFDVKTLISNRVHILSKKGIIEGVIGTKPIHAMDPEERKKLPQLKEIFVDTGLKVKEVKEIVEIGTPVTIFQNFSILGDRLCGKALDNRTAVYTLIEVLRSIKNRKLDVDFYAAFTCQEEVGIRGAKTAGYTIKPDIALAVDVTIACDIPKVTKSEQVTQLGNGVAIKVFDAGIISNPELVAFLSTTARKNKIPYQKELLPFGRTDIAEIQRNGKGAISAALSVPCRYVHTKSEMIDKNDLKACIDLLAQFLIENKKFKI